MLRPGALARAALLWLGLAAAGHGQEAAQEAAQEPIREPVQRPLESIPDEMFEMRPSLDDEAVTLTEDGAAEEDGPDGPNGPAPAASATDDVEAPAPGTVFDALRDGRFLTALRLAGDDPARRALATLTALRAGVAPPDLTPREARARAAEDLASAYTLGDVPSSVWAARAASGTELTARDVQTIAERLARAAAADRPDAAFLLADIIRATGRPEDQPRAVQLLRQAASAGLPDAQYELGVRHRFGDGVRRDEARAADLIAEAARAGLPDAQLEYGLMLFNGIGVEADREAAADLIRRAAIAGNPVAQNRLARMHARGLGVEADPYLASFWHLLARTPRDGRDEGISDPALDGFLAGVPAGTLAEARIAVEAFHPSPTPQDAATLLTVFGWPEPT